jgi:hypothetical protein
MKLELLTNATVVENAIKFVSQYKPISASNNSDKHKGNYESSNVLKMHGKVGNKKLIEELRTVNKIF